jgi:hypothetical protein
MLWAIRADEATSNVATDVNNLGMKPGMLIIGVCFKKEVNWYNREVKS